MMKYETAFCLKVLAIGGVALVLSRAGASTLRSTEAIIETLDGDLGIIEASTKKNGAPARFELTRRTRFLQNQNPVTAQDVRIGTYAILYYRYRLGKPLVTKLVSF